MTGFRSLQRLRAEERGVALVEFAISMPVLLMLLLCGLEVAHIAMAHMRISQVATLVADYAARERDSIDEADINELLLGAKLAGASIKLPQRGRIILSSLEPNETGNGQWIRWQRCTGAKVVASSYGLQGRGRRNNSLPGMGPEGNQVSASPGSAVMVAEVIYDYEPLIGTELLEVGTIHYTSAFNVRKRVDQALKNAANLPNAQKSLCTAYAA